MKKRITLLRKRPDMSEADFRAHWAEPHAKIAKGFEGLACYKQNRVDAVAWSLGRIRFEIDGFVELWFKSQEAVSRNATSTTTQALIADEPRFLSGLTALIADDSWVCHPANRAQKYMIAARTDDPDALNRDLHALLRGVDGGEPVEFSSETVTLAFTREALWHEPEPPNAITSVWVDDDAGARALVTGDGALLRQYFADRADGATAYRIDMLKIV